MWPELWFKLRLRRTLWITGTMVVAGSATAASTPDSGEAESTTPAPEPYLQVQLHPDGSWTATKPAQDETLGGATIQLNPDGTWRVIAAQSTAQSTAQSAGSSQAEPAPPSPPAPTRLTLARVEIQQKKFTRGKVKHNQYRTIYFLHIDNQTTSTLSLDPHPDHFVARSSRGATFPILAVQGCALVPQQGQCALKVIADGAPNWFGEKLTQLQVLPDALGNGQTQILNVPADVIVKRTVNDFDT